VVDAGSAGHGTMGSKRNKYVTVSKVIARCAGPREGNGISLMDTTILAGLDGATITITREHDDY
jgi:hypothetical protein